MARLVAFLRGINVGGHVVKREKLGGTFTASGLRNVATYRQSGNVIFETTAADLDETRKRLEEELRKTLGYDVAVFIRTFPQLKEVLAHEQLGRGKGEQTSLLVTLLPDSTGLALGLPLTIPKSTAVVVAASGSEVFSLTHGGGEGALPNPFLESKLKVKTTTRNMSVIREIVQRYGDDSGRKT